MSTSNGADGGAASTPPGSGSSASETHARTRVQDASTTPSSAAVAADWRQRCKVDWRWTKSANQAGVVGSPSTGEAGGFYVECAEVPGRRSYMKPLVNDPNPKNARAAREKIAADLAYDLGICVPPVVLWERADAGADARYVCASLVLFPAQWSWGFLKVRLSSATGSTAGVVKAATGCLATAAAEAMAFDTWVAQCDHNDHPHNIIFGYDPADYSARAFAFLDFAMAFGIGGRWDNGKFMTCPACPFPPLMARHVDPKHLDVSVAKIEALGEATIRQIVGRVPDAYLLPGELATIAEGLIARKSLVRSVLKRFL